MTQKGGEEPRPLRVLWLIKGLGPGGAEQLLVSSARVADHQRFTYSAAYVRPDKDHLVPALSAAGVGAAQLTRGAHGNLLWPIRLRRMMRDHDIVHAHSPLLAGVARILARTLPPARRPITVSTEHNVWGNFALPTRVLNAMTAPLDRQRWAVSGEVQRSMWPPYRGRARILIHGVVQSDHERAGAPRAHVRQALGIDDRDIVAITVANLRKEKDYPNLLNAARLAIAQDDRLVLLAVGQGPLLDDVRRLHTELELGDRVHLLGFRADVADLLSAADFFVLASEHEGLPVAIMEAMVAGLPVVSTAVGGVPEAVADGVTGLLVPSRDPDALASAITTMSQDDDARQRMSTAARESGLRFDIRHAVTEQEQRYLELGAHRGGSAP